MTQERGMIGNDTVVDKVVFITSATTLGINDQTVRLDSSGGAFALTLPNVSEARGMFYSILIRTAGNAVTVQDQDESEDWTNLTMDLADEKVVLYSDGMAWQPLASNLA